MCGEGAHSLKVTIFSEETDNLTEEWHNVNCVFCDWKGAEGYAIWKFVTEMLLAMKNNWDMVF